MKGLIMKYTYANLDALIKAFQGGELYGYSPAESYDATTFQFPVEVETNEDDKSFIVTQSPAKIEKGETLNALFKENTKKVPFYKKGWFWFAVAAVVVVIIGVCFALKG